MQTNDVIYAKTHADFLNIKFGTKYKAWMKSCYTLNSKYEVWMVYFDEKERKGWKNYYLGDIIKDVNCDLSRKNWNSIPLHQTLYHTKLVFQIVDSKHSERKYIFKGVYEFQKDISDPYKVRVYKKISDSFFF